MCNDIGEAAYEDSLVGAALLDALAALPGGAAARRRLAERYGVPWAPGLSSAPRAAARAARTRAARRACCKSAPEPGSAANLNRILCSTRWRRCSCRLAVR
jgi:alkanesulfonate monooxygenase SsuD/methylene tetrahydromethanopterin reductase-like flavin-dependent oxidoreductase (luciferase family)